MKLGELLEERARLIAEIEGLLRLRSRTFVEQADSPSEVRFEDITKEIEQKRKELRKLKIKLIKANLSTRVPEASDVSNLMELNLKITDIISEIDSLKRLSCADCYGEDKPQLSPRGLKERIFRLVREKVRLDVMRKTINWTTEVE